MLFRKGQWNRFNYEGFVGVVSDGMVQHHWGDWGPTTMSSAFALCQPLFITYHKAQQLQTENKVGTV